MKDTRSEFGYEFTNSLCKAITKVREKEEEQNPNVFAYKGLQLRYAIERSLYFSFANHAGLFELFVRWKENKLPKEIMVEDDIEQKLITIMCGLDPGRVKVRARGSSVKKICKRCVRSVIRFFRLDRLAQKIRNTIHAQEQKNSHYEVLFYVISERFVKYMKPVFDRMPVLTAYLTDDANAKHFLEKENIPFIKISSFLYRLNRWSEKDSWLKRFLITEHYELVADSIIRLKPKSIILVEGNASQYELVNQICKMNGIQCICIQQGWSPIIHNGFQNMTFSKMLVWGDGFARDLAPYNPNQRFISTGSFAIRLSEIKEIKTNQKIRL